MHIDERRRKSPRRPLRTFLAGLIVLATLPVPGPGIGWAATLQQSAATCSACHGADGNSTDPQFPKLAGQKASYLAAQLRDFRSGARKSDAMSAMSSNLTDSQIEELAEFFSRKTVEPDKVGNAALAAAGKRIFFSGSPRSPSCNACHGSGGGGMGMMMGRGGMGRMGMMGNIADVPDIRGQHAPYVVKQLDAFASGARPATVMGPISERLSEAERKAVAIYVSGIR